MIGTRLSLAKRPAKSEAQRRLVGDALFHAMLLLMTKLLEQAPDNERDSLLTPEQRADVTRIRNALQSGQTRLATDEETAALWKKCGL
jgi:hypothetical protein